MKNSGAGVRVEAPTSRVFDRDDMRRIALRERARIRATLSTLDEEQWAAPSLCEGWTVRDVAAHLAQNTRAGLYDYLVGLAAVGFNHAVYHRRATVDWTKRPTSQLVGALDGTQMRFTCRRHPSRCVVDFVVHHQDIRRPLGLGLDVPEEALLAALQTVTTDDAFATDYRRATGLRLVATDVPWVHGDGPVEVHGRAEALLMAIMGRPVEAELSGPETAGERYPATAGRGARTVHRCVARTAP